MTNTIISNYKEGIKIIRFYIKEYRSDFFTLGVLSTVSALTGAIIPFLVGRLIDNIAKTETIFQKTSIEMPIAFGFIAAWFIVKIISDITDRQITLKSERLEVLIDGDYIARGIGKILEFPVSFHKSHKMGEVLDRINRASGWLSQITSRILIDLAPQFLSIIFALIITFYIKSELAFILAAAVFFYAVILIRIAPGLSRLQIKMFKAYNQAYGDAYDTIYNVQTVKQAVAENYEKRKHSRGFRKAVSAWIRLAAIWQSLSFYQKLIVSLTQLAIFAFSIIYIRSGAMTIGELVMFNGYAAMLFGPFVILGRNWQNFQNGLSAIVRAENILDTRAETYEPKNPVLLSEVKGKVEFKNVSFKYKKDSGLILENINFKVETGQIIALVGESGVGKTTLVDLLSLYYPPTSGTIYVDGHNIKNLDLRFLRSRIGIVPQEVILFNDTIKNNIKYGKFGATDKEMKKAAQAAHADEFIESFPKKYNQVVGERGIRLSTGQKQRIAIARAVLRNPRILILDEPTSALDAKSEKLISESLEKLMLGRTTFIIAHRLSTVRGANIILVLDKGRIVESGQHEELVKIPNGVYKKLYELQIGLK